MSYLKWDSRVISDLSAENIDAMYDKGYVFTRVGKGVMNQTRSFRIDLSRFELSSENRRILRKAEHLALASEPLPYKNYGWQIGKLAKDFYEKFGDSVFTANKAREIITDPDKSNFNLLLVFGDTRDAANVGFAIGYRSETMFHYAFPFYVEDAREPSRGLGMMTMVIQKAKECGKKYVYLGSLSRPSDTYKLQFKGGEWFDGAKWRTDIEPLKEILKP
ncbi:MAG TPA: GNAT family N-acetyltransferase [Candidatus Paceibacterota bacterium]|jgi:hypothetical protein|nr:GNAT family N-acetyltransferase [Candidatus Paceibacterota bacterium]